MRNPKPSVLRASFLLLVTLGFGGGFFWNLLHWLARSAPPVDTWWHRAMLDGIFAVTLVCLERER